AADPDRRARCASADDRARAAMSPLIGLVVYGAILAVVVLAVRNTESRARMRRLEGARTTIADREIVTLTGIARALDAQLVAPLSGIECLAYAAYARQISPVPGESGYSDARIARFVLDTSEGLVHVEAPQIAVEIRATEVSPRDADRE